MEGTRSTRFRTPLTESKTELFSGLNRVKVYIKDESRNPFGTFKDRRCSALIEQYSRIDPLYFVQISSGNSAYSMAKFAEMARNEGRNVEVVNIIPKEVRPEIKQKLSEYPRLVEVDLSKKEITFEEMQRIVRKHTGLDIPGDNILGVEKHNLEGGYRQIVHEIKEQLAQMGETPTHIFCPVGEGELLTEIAQEAELVFEKNTPKIVGVTIDNNVFVHPDGKEDGFVRIKEVGVEVADKLVNGYSKFWKAVKGMEQSGRVELKTAEAQEIADMYYELEHLSINAEPSAAIAFCGAMNYEFQPDDVVVIINSGKGIYSEEVAFDIAKNRNPPGKVRLKDGRLVGIPEIEDKLGDVEEVARKHPMFEVLQNPEIVKRATEIEGSSVSKRARESEKRAIESLVKEIDELGASRKGATFLECGCSSGEYLPWALEKFESVIGVDFSRPSLKLAAKKVASENPEAVSRLRLVEGDFSNMRWLPSESVDFAVCSSNTLENQSEAMQMMALLEIKRIMKPVTADSVSMIMFSFYTDCSDGRELQIEYYKRIGFEVDEYAEGCLRLAMLGKDAPCLEKGEIPPRTMGIFRNSEGKRIKSQRFSGPGEIERMIGEHFGIVQSGGLKGGVNTVYAVPKTEKNALAQELLKATVENKIGPCFALLAADAPTEERDAEGNTPLCITASRGYSGRTVELLKHGADISAKNKQGRTPLMLACLQDGVDKGKGEYSEKSIENRYLGVIESLLENGSDIFERDNGGMGALSAAIRGGDKYAPYAICRRAGELYSKEMKKAKKKFLEEKKNEGSEGLPKRDDDEKLEGTYLEIQYRFSDLFENEAGLNPLMYTIMKKDFELSEMLIKLTIMMRGNPFEEKYNRKSALTVALDEGEECTLFILEQMEKHKEAIEARCNLTSFNMDTPAKNGMTPLCMIASLRNEKSVEIINRMVKLGADIEKESLAGQTPLEIAIKNKNVEVATSFVDIGNKKHEKNMKKYEEVWAAIDSGDMDKAYKLKIKNAVMRPQSVNSKVLFKTLKRAKKDRKKVEAVDECVRNYNKRKEAETGETSLDWGVHGLVEMNDDYDWDYQTGIGIPRSPPYMLEKIIELGIDLEETDSEGRTALIYAIDAGLEKAAIMLVEGGAKTDVATNQGKAVLDLAEEKGMEDLKKWVNDPKEMRAQQEEIDVFLEGKKN